MLTAPEKRNVASSSGESQGFTIKAGAKAFQILRDGLYSRKEEAICRETFTNAYDAHLMVGKADVPFEVTFPSVFDSTFRVRDFGPGMDHDFMMGSYSVAFHSTKDETNDQVGGFGLGRMSAFSYTDTYSVTIWQNGEKRFYSLLIGELGVPEVHFLGSTPSDEPDGTEVSFPISSKDTRTFAEAMRRVAFGFDVKPLVLDQENPWHDATPAIDKRWYRVYKGLQTGPLDKGIYAKVGCVLYPVTTSIIRPRELNSLEYNDVLVIDFPVGSLAVSVSREELSYGDKEPTEKVIEEAFQRVAQALRKDAQESISKAGSYQEAQELARRFSSLVSNPTWCGQEVNKYGYVIRSGVGGSLQVAQESGYQLRNRKNRAYRADDEVAYRLNAGGRTIYTDRGSGRALVFLIDVDQRIVRLSDRMTEYYNNHTCDPVVYIKFSGSEKDHLASIQDFMVKFPKFDFVDVSKLPDPGPTKRGSTGPIKAKKVVKDSNWGKTSYLQDVELTDTQFQEGGIFVRTLNSESEEFVSINGNKRSYCLEDLVTMWPAYKEDTGTKQEFLVAVPKTIQKRFIEAPQWVTVEDAFGVWFNTDLPKTRKRLALFSIDKDHRQKVKSLPFVEELGTIRPLVSRAESITLTPKERRLAWLDHKGPKIEEVIKLSLKKVYSTYPLLKYYTEESHEDFEKYYNLMKGKVHEQV